MQQAAKEKSSWKPLSHNRALNPMHLRSPNFSDLERREQTTSTCDVGRDMNAGQQTTRRLAARAGVLSHCNCRIQEADETRSIDMPLM